MLNSVLVLTRRPGQSVVLNMPGTTVLVKVYQVKNGQAGLAFVAPPAVQILREELCPVLAEEMLASINQRNGVNS